MPLTDLWKMSESDQTSREEGLNSDQPHGGDERSALEMAVIKESLSVTRSRPRWIPHNVNPADALTKMDGAHTQPMLDLLKSNPLRIEEETDVLSRGKQSESRLKTSLRNSKEL